jgi:hypothetical protein
VSTLWRRRRRSRSIALHTTTGVTTGVTKTDAGSGWAITAAVSGGITTMTAMTPTLLVREIALAPGMIIFAIPSRMAANLKTGTATTTT